MLSVCNQCYTFAFIFLCLNAFLQCVSSVIHKSTKYWWRTEAQDIPNSLHGRHCRGNFVTQKALCCSVPGPPGKEVKTEIVWSMETLILVFYSNILYLVYLVHWNENVNTRTNVSLTWTIIWRNRGSVQYAYVKVVSINITHSLRCHLLNIPRTVNSCTTTFLVCGHLLFRSASVSKIIQHWSNGGKTLMEENYVITEKSVPVSLCPP
jgi:hypothetical protein